MRSALRVWELLLAVLPTSFALCPTAQMKSWSTLGTSGDISIPVGTQYIASTSATLGVVDVYGDLFFPTAATAWVNVSALRILVHSGGHLWIGSEECPVLGTVDITLRGDIVQCGSTCPYPGPEGVGTKVIGVLTGGQMDIWGNPYIPWTVLAEHAMAGATTITLATEVDWPVGSELVIASTEFEDFDLYYGPFPSLVPEHERRTIVSVSKSGSLSTIKLSAPLVYNHYGQIYFPPQATNGDAVDMRAEVGLLTRNVKIHGDLSGGACTSTWNHGTGSNVVQWDKCWGATTLVQGGASARIAYAEFYHVGQAEELARYPVHFHLGGNQSNSMVLGNAVHDSFQRCYVIHGTDSLLVKDNVAYNSSGHCYFIEDGNEVQNVLMGNLGVATRRHFLLNSDAQPAIFWITNPTNHFYLNHAVSGQFGFWFSFPIHPTGAANVPANAWEWFNRNAGLGDFVGNVAHSCDDTGVFFDRGQNDQAGDVDAQTQYDPVDWSAFLGYTSNPATFISGLADYQRVQFGVPAYSFVKDLTVFKNSNWGLWARGSSMLVDGFRSSDNTNGCVFPLNQNVLQNSVFVGESDNTWPPICPLCNIYSPKQQGQKRPNIYWRQQPILGYNTYDVSGGDVLMFSRFYNFTDQVLDQIGDPNNPIRYSGAISGINGPNAIHPKQYMLGVSFPGSTVPNRVHITLSDHLDRDPYLYDVSTQGWAQYDHDGSLTGTCGSYVTTRNPLARTSGCVSKGTWNAYVCPPNTGTIRAWQFDCSGLTCGPPSNYNYSGYNQYYTGITLVPATIYRMIDGVSLENMSPNLAYRTNLLMGLDYLVLVNGNNAQLTYAFVSTVYLSTGEFVRMGYPFKAGTKFTVRDVMGAALALADTKSTMNFTNPWFWDSVSNVLWLHHSVATNSWEWEHGQFPVNQASRAFTVSITCPSGGCGAVNPPIPTLAPTLIASAPVSAYNPCFTNGPGGVGALTVSVGANQPAGGVVFDETVISQWTPNAQCTVITAASANVAAPSGDNIMRCNWTTVAPAYGVASIYLVAYLPGATPLDVTPFTHFQFKARMDPTFGNDGYLNVNAGSNWLTLGPTIPSEDLKYGPGYIREDEWRTYTIPLSDLGVGVGGIASVGYVGLSYYRPRPVSMLFDSIAFITASTSTTAVTSWATPVPEPAAKCPSCAAMAASNTNYNNLPTNPPTVGVLTGGVISRSSPIMMMVWMVCGVVIALI